jgi:glycerophosphoryl diester phosphodiesterase
VRRVGHKGADLLEPGNTTASFDAALAHGVDMIEFDVLPEVFGDPEHSRLVLSHDYTHDVTKAPSLEDGLDHLTDPRFAGIDLDVDLKLPGYEDRVLKALAERELLPRTLVSTMYVETLARLRELDPKVKIGWSVPKARKDYTASRLTKVPAAAMLAYGRRVVPARAAQAIADGRCDAIMCFHRLVTPRLVKAVHGAGGELYAWTVDDATDMARLHRMGVTGVISNDPRLFAQVMSQTAAL